MNPTRRIIRKRVGISPRSQAITKSGPNRKQPKMFTIQVPHGKMGTRTE